MLVAFDGADLEPTALMAEAAHGTAPSLEGKNVANPLAMILAAAALLSQTDEERRGRGPCDPRGGPRGGREGVKTADLVGNSTTTEFTDEVIRRTRHEARGLVDALGGARHALRQIGAPSTRAPRRRRSGAPYRPYRLTASAAALPA